MKGKPARCRFCGAPLRFTFVDLGMSPLCESYVSQEALNHMEPFYPLHVYVCQECFLVQIEEYVAPEEIFNEYAYFSSFADSWLAHAKAYTDMAVKRFQLDGRSFVVELGSNDGYLLQYFAERGIPAVGVEPAMNVAEVAMRKGIQTLVKYFGTATAKELAIEGKQADLIIGNNVLAQVPDLNDFVEGIRILLKPTGVATLEFPHLFKLMEGNQFDTIYHEHFSYFSFITAERIFSAHGMTIFDVEELSTHGGSLRIFARHKADQSKQIEKSVLNLRAREEEYGFRRMETYSMFDEQVKETKRKILEFLISVKRARKKIAGYGAPGKGNTLLNYCGIRTDFIDYTVDRNPYKQGKYLPGTHIPIFHPDKIYETKPDFIFILAWNFKDEIMEQMNYISEWGGKFIIPIPEITVIGGNDSTVKE